MKTLCEIVVPKDTVNDDEVLVTDVLFTPGDAVAEGDLLLVFETSKASVEIEAPAPGYVTYRCAEGEHVAVGSVVAVLTDEPAADAPAAQPPADASEAHSEDAGSGEPVFSRAARTYMERKDIDPALFAGRDLVSLDDVLALTTSEADDGRIPVIVLGGGGHGQVLADMVAGQSGFRLKGFLDDGKERGDTVDGHPVLGALPDLPALCAKEPVAALVAVGLVSPDPGLRIRAYALIEEAGALTPPCVHPSATVDPRAVLGPGVQVHAGAVVGPHAVLDRGAVVNTNGVVSHHCRVGAHTHIAPGAVLAGEVTVGQGCLVGMGVTTYVGITIGDGCVIENGVALFKSVPAGQRVSAR